ncbi:hypothetical protein NEPAR08_1288 [Nematocida parisii]|nr:hypothetical protein NEPAR08_1288 [Nematocida parisii]KAI5128585.1 hypothetical protein NEPAR03_1392 [Nematocida parisii]
MLRPICNLSDIIWLVCFAEIVLSSSVIGSFMIRPLVTKMYVAFMDIKLQDTRLLRDENEQNAYQKNIIPNNILCSILALILLTARSFCPNGYALVTIIIMQFACILSAFAWSGFLFQILRIYLKGGLKKKSVLNHETSHKKNIFLLFSMFMITILAACVWWLYFVIMAFGSYIFMPGSLCYNS